MKTKTISKMTRPEAVRGAVIHAAARDGLNSRSTRKVARYGVHLLARGLSAAYAIAQAIHYGRVLSGRDSWHRS